VYPARTGGKKFIANFYEYLAKIYPVSFISVPENAMPEESTNSFYGVLGTTKLRYGNFLLFFKLRKILRKNKITDLIIVHPYYGWLAWLLKKNTGVKLSLLSHNIEAVRFKSMGKWWWKMLWFYEKNTHKIIDHNFFVTQEDLDFAVNNYRLDAAKCDVITYGIDWEQSPSIQKKKDAALILRQQYNIKEEEKVLLFNGTLDYKPNIEAINYILEEINPLFLKNKDYHYKIIICGKGLPAAYNELKNYSNVNIIFAGFVDDINLFFKGADIFLNPLITGGGIKTKLVEALGNNLTSISCKSGAFGIPSEIAGSKLTVVNDFDWVAFADAVFAAEVHASIPASFFNHFYWANIAAKAGRIISGN
jgi:glycosyltransferase involved in cell wall biosynthesis